jgi:hypothetical protein
LEPAFRGTPVVESSDALRLGNPIEFKKTQLESINMKPTPQLSSHARSLRGDIRGSPSRGAFPLTDYNFQSSTGAPSASSSLPGKTRRSSDLHRFWKLSSEFLGGETTRDYVKEGILFSIIVAVSAWPIFTMIVALARLAR